MDKESIPERRYAKLRREVQQLLAEAEQEKATGDDRFPEQYEKAITATEQLLVFQAALPALLQEPRRARKQRLVTGLSTASALLPLAGIIAVFATDRTTWWLAALLPQLLLALLGYGIDVTAQRQRRQVGGVVVLTGGAVLLTLILLGVLSLIGLVVVAGCWWAYGALTLAELGETRGQTGAKK